MYICIYLYLYVYNTLYVCIHMCGFYVFPYVARLAIKHAALFVRAQLP